MHFGAASHAGRGLAMLDEAGTSIELHHPKYRKGENLFTFGPIRREDSKFASDEKSIRQPITSFVRCYLKTLHCL